MNMLRRVARLVLVPALWVVASSTPSTFYAQAQSKERPLAVSPNGRHLVTKKTSWAILDGATDSPIGAAKVYPPLDDNSTVAYLAMTEDGSVVVGRQGNDGYGWFTPGTAQTFKQAGRANAKKLSALRDKIVVVTADEKVLVLQEGVAQVLYQPAASEIISSIAVSGNGKRAAYACVKRNSDGASAGFFIEVKALDGSGYVRRIETTTTTVSLAFSPDGERLIAFFGDPKGSTETDRARWLLWRMEDGKSFELRLDPSLAPKVDAATSGGTSPVPQGGTPMPTATPVAAPTQYLTYQWDSLAGSFSPDGNRIVISNILGGLAVFDASGERASEPVHSYTIPLQSWATSHHHGHRWSGPWVVAYSAPAKEISLGEAKGKVWRVNVDARQAERVTFHSDISRLTVAADVSSVFRRLFFDDAGRPRIVASFRQSRFTIYSLPGLRKRGNGVSLDDVPAEAGGAEAKTDYFGSPNHAVFNDGVHFAVEDAQGVRVVNAQTGAVVAEAPKGMAFGHTGDDGWALYTRAEISPGNRLRAVFYKGTQKVGEIDETVTGPKKERLWIGYGGAARGPVGPIKYTPETITVTAYDTSGKRLGNSILVTVVFRLNILLYGRLGNEMPGVLTNRGPDSLWRLIMSDTPDEFLSPNEGNMSSDGRRLGGLFLQREGEVVTRAKYRVWILQAHNRLVEKKYTAAERIDTSEFRKRFPNSTKFLAISHDLRLVAMPVGNQIHVIDIDTDKLIATAPLGEPLAVGDGYFLLSSPEGEFQVWPLPIAPH